MGDHSDAVPELLANDDPDVFYLPKGLYIPRYIHTLLARSETAASGWLSHPTEDYRGGPKAC
jgi:hypothetical protein